MVHAEKRAVISDLITRAHTVGSHALVVGCGLGEDAEVVGKPAVAVDLSAVALVEARQRYSWHTYLVADAHNLPFVDDSFDTIVCSEVIEHVQDPLQMLAEFQRVLRRHGLLVVTTPNWSSFYGIARYLGELVLRRPVTSAGQPIDHWYTKGLLEEHLNPYFEINEWRGVWFFPPIGRGRKTLPTSIVVPLLRFLLPVEHFLQSRLSAYAHLLAVSCVARGTKLRNQR